MLHLAGFASAFVSMNQGDSPLIKAFHKIWDTLEKGLTQQEIQLCGNIARTAADALNSGSVSSSLFKMGVDRVVEDIVNNIGK